MPELVNMGAEGWVGISDDDATSVCERSVKNLVHAFRSSSAVIGTDVGLGMRGRMSVPVGSCGSVRTILAALAWVS